MPDDQTATSWLARTGFALGIGALGGIGYASARYWTRVSSARYQLQQLIAANAGGSLRIVITGATSGIGQELAQQFSKNASVSLLLGCRNVTRAEQLFRKSGNCKIVPLELLDFDSVQSFTDEAHAFLSDGSEDAVRMLINNAGVMRAPPSRSATSTDPTWTTNFLSPFLLTELLVHRRRLAQQTQPVHTINVSSRLEKHSKLDEALLENVRNGEVGKKSYSDSKRAMMLWIALRSESISCQGHLLINAATPGMVNSDLGRNSVKPWLWPLTWPLRAVLLKSCAEGALLIAEAGLQKQSARTFGMYMDGSKSLEDLVKERMGQKALGEEVIEWASQVTGLPERVARYEH